MSKEVVKGMIFLPGSWKDCIFFIKKKMLLTFFFCMDYYGNFYWKSQNYRFQLLNDSFYLSLRMDLVFLPAGSFL